MRQIEQGVKIRNRCINRAKVRDGGAQMPEATLTNGLFMTVSNAKSFGTRVHVDTSTWHTMREAHYYQLQQRLLTDAAAAVGGRSEVTWWVDGRSEALR